MRLWSLARKSSRGFTLLELLVVIGLVGILAAIVMMSLSDSRSRGRDATRIRIAQELENAIELFYAANGHYPAFTDNGNTDARSGTTLCPDNKNRGNTNWCALMILLEPYYPGGSGDPRNVAPNVIYYDADGSTPQSYGLMVMFESSTNDQRAQTDGGFYCTVGVCSSNTRGFELGTEPRYCMLQGNRDWRTGGVSICS